MALQAVKDIKRAVEAFPGTMVAEAEDLKRAELRIGEGANGPLPNYSPPYLIFKNTLESYKASSGRADLFVTGTWAASIKTTEKDGVLTNGLENPPDYASELAEYSGGEPEGWSDEGEENFMYMSSLRLRNQIIEILNV